MSSLKINKGETLERVFLNEPSLDLHIMQEAGSSLRIGVINIPNTTDEIINRIRVEQLGEGCRTEIYGLAYLHGEEKVTIETHVLHAVGGGSSNQLIKFVLDDNAKGHFVGDLKIAQDAQKTEAHQTNRNLVLSEEATMRTQPQLEIYADDVQATHGASTGQLDETALFYMRQRGIAKKKARQLLVNAFMKEVIDKMPVIDRDLSIEEPVLASLLNTIDGVVE